MNWDYRSEIEPFGREYKDGGIIVEHNYTLEELYEKQSQLEQWISEKRLEEPPKKRNNKNEYRAWFGGLHRLIDELHTVRDEIEKIIKQ